MQSYPDSISRDFPGAIDTNLLSFDFIADSAEYNVEPSNGRKPGIRETDLTPRCYTYLHEKLPELFRPPSLPIDAPIPKKEHIRLRLFLYLWRTPFRDQDTMLPVITREQIREIAGVSPTNNRFVARAYLDDLASIVRLTVSDYTYTKQKARTVELELHPALEAELRRCDRTLVIDPNSRCVNALTGKTVSRRKCMTDEASEHRQLVNEANDSGNGHSSPGLLYHLNGQSQSVFRKYIRQNIADAYRAAEAMPVRNYLECRKRDHALSVLAALRQRPWMIYHAVERSDRLYTYASPLNLLPRMLRHLILRGAATVDLASAQLAIVAHLWNVRSLANLLGENVSIWQELLARCGLSASAKGLIKQAIYSIIFGMTHEKVTDLLRYGNKEYSPLPSEAVETFVQHSVIVELFQRRRYESYVVYRGGGARDAYGNWISTIGSNYRGVLAQQAQSYEFHLMESLLPEFRGDQRWRVLNWLHDGLTVQYEDRSRQPAMIRRLVARVHARAAELRIATHLEVEDLEVWCDSTGRIIVRTGGEDTPYDWPELSPERVEAAQARVSQRDWERRHNRRRAPTILRLGEASEATGPGPA